MKKKLNHLKTYENYVTLILEKNDIIDGENYRCAMTEEDPDEYDNGDYWEEAEGGPFPTVSGVVDWFRNRKSSNNIARSIIEEVIRTFNPNRLQIYKSNYDDDCFIYRLNDNTKIEVIEDYRQESGSSDSPDDYTNYELLVNDESIHCANRFVRQLLRFFSSVKHRVPVDVSKEKNAKQPNLTSPPRANVETTVNKKQVANYSDPYSDPPKREWKSLKPSKSAGKRNVEDPAYKHSSDYTAFDSYKY